MPVSLILCVALLGPVEVTGEEAVAAAIQNVVAAKTLRVRWSQTAGATQECRDYFDSRIRVIDRKLADKARNYSADDKAFLEKVRAGHVVGRRIADRPPETRAWDFWTDRRNCQVREPRAPEERASLKFLPDFEAVPNRLTTDFKQTLVTSWGEVTAGKFRLWTANKMDAEHFSGAVDEAYPSTAGRLPPLAIPRTIPFRMLHPYDLFFVPQAQTFLAGWAKLNGEEVLTVARLFLDSPEVANYLPGKHLAVVGFLHPEKNFMPVRLEISLADPTYQPKTADPCLSGDCPVQRLVRDIKLQEFHSAGPDAVSIFYPVSGIEEDYRMAASDSDDPEMRVSPHERRSWQTDLVEVNREISVENFALKFPEGTIYSQSSTGDILVTGDRDGFAKRVVAAAIKPTTEPPANYRWITAVIVLSLGGLFWLYRQKSR